MANSVTIARGLRARRQAGNTQTVVLIAALVAVILVGIGTTIYLAIRPPQDEARRERADRPIHFRCQRCNHEFSMIPTDFHKQWLDVDLSKLPPGSQHKAHCPKCGQQFCAAIVEERLGDDDRLQAGRSAAASQPGGAP